MHLSSTLLSIVGVLALVLGFTSYAQNVSNGTNSKRPLGVAIGIFVGVLCALISLFISYWLNDGSWETVVIFSVVTSLSSILLLFIHSQRKVPTETIKIKLEDSLPKFLAVTSENISFDSHSLTGQRVLLKFFRGEWCPFCQAELKRFEAMQPQLEMYQIQVFALSKDTPQQATKHKIRDKLSFTLLCDPSMVVIRQFGLEHQKALQVSGWFRFRFFGQMIGMVPSFTSMAAATTILIDEQNKIRWIDQSEDYKVRSDTVRVLRQIEAVFGTLKSDISVVR